MGQIQGSYINPLFADWYQHPNHNNIFINSKTNQEVQAHLVSLKKIEEPYLRKRMQQHHNFIAKILYYEPAEKNKPIRDETKFIVYTERLYPVSHQMWVPVTSALSILKGFRRLSSSYGIIRVMPNMVKVNIKKQIQVWVTDNPLKNEIILKAESQEQMLADIVRIIMDFDSPTGSLMIKCFTLNQAINNVLHSITQNKSAVHFSSRTTKKQDKLKVITKQTVIVNYNPFRSTKQTQDDSLKPFNDSSSKYSVTKKESSIHSPTQTPTSTTNYLQNVNILKSPMFINTDQNLGIDSPKKIQSPGFRKTPNQGSITTNYNFTQPSNNVQKQSSIQFNNSQPGKTTPTGRQFKQVQYKSPIYSQSISRYNTLKIQSQASPTYQRPPNVDHLKYKQEFYKSQYLNSYQPQRKSNITKNYLQRIQRMDVSQQTDPQNQTTKTGKTSYQINFNQRSEINTSREFMGSQPQSFVRRYTSNQQNSGIFFDSNRTKTQQFYSTNSQFGSPPRIRTNYIHQNVPINNKSQIAQSNINIVKKYSEESQLVQTGQKAQPQQQIDSVIRYSSEADTKDKNKTNSEAQGDEKKIQKMKQAQKIKQQMGCLGIINSNTSPSASKSLINEKSLRDLLIKQKVQQKNKKHEQLKCAITKLLND